MNSTAEDLSNLRAGVYKLRAFVDNVLGSGTVNREYMVNDEGAAIFEGLTQITSCRDKPDGSVTLTIIEGIAPFSFKWFDDELNLVSTEQSPETLHAGKHYVQVTDGNGCKSFGNFIILFENLGVNFIPTTTQLLVHPCPQTANGSIDLSNVPNL